MQLGKRQHGNILYETNTQYLKNLDYFIAAGLMKIKEMKEVTLKQLQEKADKTKDPLDVQKLQDFNQALNRFEPKIHDLKLSRIIAIQTGIRSFRNMVFPLPD